MLNLVVLLTVTSRMLTEVLKLSQTHTRNVYNEDWTASFPNCCSVMLKEVLSYWHIQCVTMKIEPHHSPIVVA